MIIAIPHKSNFALNTKAWFLWKKVTKLLPIDSIVISHNSVASLQIVGKKVRIASQKMTKLRLTKNVSSRHGHLSFLSSVNCQMPNLTFFVFVTSFGKLVYKAHVIKSETTKNAKILYCFFGFRLHSKEQTFQGSEAFYPVWHLKFTISFLRFFEDFLLKLMHFSNSIYGFFANFTREILDYCTANIYTTMFTMFPAFIFHCFPRPMSSGKSISASDVKKKWRFTAI